MSREYKYVSLSDLLKTNPVQLTKFTNAAPTFCMASPEQNIEEISENVKAEEEEEVETENEVEEELNFKGKRIIKGRRGKLKIMYLMKKEKRQLMK
ncbi:hypothetical protein RDI58_026362 [Solanum bulbocastanum]|uniref:Uncharacterized protein n=1 Tax=Solanum bulbocastanum TaxID=147425 RepID=A0AAN8Y132_SOLBU